MSITSLFARTPIAQPLGISTKMIEAPTEEYIQLAKRLGIALAIEKSVLSLEDVLREENIHVYPMADVSRYMSRITPSGKLWVWKPCREVDKNKCRNTIVLRQANGGGGFDERVYNKPIPLPVLMTMEKIEDAMSRRVAFFVSDYVSPNPDPFLMVTIPSSGESQNTEANGRLWVANPEPECFVVERWDEPSFRER